MIKEKYRVIIRGKEIKSGDIIKDFRGDEYEFVGVTNPGTSFGGMNGKIQVKNGDFTREYYPCVFNAKLELVDTISINRKNDIEERIQQAKNWKEKVEEAVEAEDLEEICNEILNATEDIKDINYAGEDIYLGFSNVMDDEDAYDRGPVTYVKSVKMNMQNILDDFIDNYKEDCEEEEKEENSKQLYICTNDFQGGDFGVGRVGTIDDWREIAISWSDTEGMEDSIISTPDNELINFIQEIWEIEIEEYDRNKEYDLYCNYTHGNGLFFEENAKEILKVLSNAKYDLQNLIQYKENLNSIFISEKNIDIKDKLYLEIDKKIEEIMNKNNISSSEYEKIAAGVKKEVSNNNHLLDLGKDRLNNIFENCNYKEAAEVLFSFNYNKEEVIDAICDGETNEENIKKITDIVESIENDSEEESL